MRCRSFVSCGSYTDYGDADGHVYGIRHGLELLVVVVVVDLSRAG